MPDSEMTKDEYDVTQETTETEVPPVTCRSRFVSYVKSHLFMQLVFIVYSMGGAAIFNEIERDNELESIQQVARLRNETLRKLWELAHNENITNEGWNLKAYEQILLYQSTVSDLLQPAMILGTDEPIWNFWSSLLFCGTVITTIGYGFIAPKTDTGRAVCIPYALVGIPLCLMVIAHLGQYMTLALKKIWYHLFMLARFTRIGECCHLWKKHVRYRIRQLRERKGGDTKRQISNGGYSNDAEATMPDERSESEDTVYEEDDFEPSPVFSVIFVVVYALLGALMYRRWEGWGYLESIYFIVVSLTTIGFGDINPKHHKFFILASIYLLIGLALVSMLINTLVIFAKKGYKQAKKAAAEVEQKLEKAKDAIGAIIHDSEEEDEDFLKNKIKQYVVNPRLSIQSDMNSRMSIQSDRNSRMSIQSERNSRISIPNDKK